MGELADDLQAIRTIAEETTVSEADAIDATPGWPEKTLRAIQGAGLAGWVISREHGGLGHDLLGMTRACEILGRRSASAGLCFGMHLVGCAVLDAKATEDHVERFLRPIAEGKHITTLALSEPGTGSHFYYPETELSAGGNGSLLLNGHKSLATNGGHADSYVVSTRSLEQGPEGGLFSCVMLPGDAEGLEWDEPYNGMGMRGNSSRGFRMKDVQIPRNNLLGEDGDQIWYVFHVVAPYFLVSMAGTYLGLMQRAFEIVQGHLAERSYTHTGKRLADESVLQHRLGNIWSDVERTRRLVYWAAEEAGQGGEQAVPALCSAKADIAGSAVNVVNECLTLAGGQGYAAGGELARLLRDARAAHVMAPTTDILRVWTGRALLDLPLLEE